MNGVAWYERAACAGQPVLLFYGPPAEPVGDRDAREAEAKTFCGRCPVRTDCQDTAISGRVKTGVWGGLNGPERDAEHRRRRQRGRTA